MASLTVTISNFVVYKGITYQPGQIVSLESADARALVNAGYAQYGTGGVDATPPSAPALVIATVQSPTVVIVTWSAATDNVGVSGYRVSRGGVQIASVSPDTFTFTDTTAPPGTGGLIYSVVAVDAAGNVSNPGQTSPVSTPTVGTTGSSPTGPAGGDLTGTYPNPTVALSSITVGKISAGGTPSATTYLRGDGQWAAPAGGGGGAAIDTVASDIQATVAGLAVAGAVGKAADAAHRHPVGAHTHADTTNGGKIGLAALSLGGTASAATFLRGDGQWAAPPTSSGGATINTNAAAIQSTTTSVAVAGSTTTAADAGHRHPLGTHTHADASNGGLIGVAAITATGAASATTYLRGDGTWATPPAGGGTGAPQVVVNTTLLNADTTAARNVHYEIDASSGPVTITLSPTGLTNGDILSFEKYDTSQNQVTVSGAIRGAGTFTNRLAVQYHLVGYRFRSSDNTFWPAWGHIPKPQLDALYAPLGSAFTQIVAEDGGDLWIGMNLRANGIKSPGPVTLSALVVDLDLPAETNGSVTLRFLINRPGSNPIAAAPDMTINGMTIRGVASGLALSLLSTDSMMIQVINGSGAYLGTGITVTAVLNGGTVPTVTAPAVPTGLTGTYSGGNASLTWTNPAAATSAIVAKSPVGGIVWTPIEDVAAAVARYTDPLTAGGSMRYAVASRVPGAMSALTAPITVSGQTGWSFFNQADGAPAGMTTILGATDSTQQITVASNTLRLISGAHGSLSNADKVGAQFTLDSARHFIYDVSGLFALDTSASVVDLYLGATSDAADTGMAGGGFPFYDGWQIELNSIQVRLGFKQYGGGFTTLVDYSTAGYPTPVNANGTTFYAFRAVIVDPGNGTYRLDWYQGPSTSLSTFQSGGGTPALSASITAAQRTALHAGYAYFVQLGHTNQTTPSPTTQGSRWQSLSVKVA